MKDHFLFPRIVAIFLSLGLALPEPALALRPSQEGTGLEELQDALKRFSHLVFPHLSRSPAVSSGMEEKLDRVKRYLKVTYLEPDGFLDTAVELPEEMLLLRVEHGISGLQRLYWLSGEDPTGKGGATFPGGIYSNAAVRAFAQDPSRSPLEGSVAAMEGYASRYQNLHGLILASEGGWVRELKRDAFISFTRSPVEIFSLVRQIFFRRSDYVIKNPGYIVFIVKIPRGERIIDRSYLGENAILIPHFVPRDWIVAVVTNDTEIHQDLQEPILKKRWKGQVFLERRLDLAALSRRLRQLGIRDRDCLPRRSVKGDVRKGLVTTNLEGKTIDPATLRIKWSSPAPAYLSRSFLPANTDFEVYPDQTLREALRTYPVLYHLIFPNFKKWSFSVQTKTGGLRRVTLGTRLKKGDIVFLKQPPAGLEEPTAGLEEPTAGLEELPTGLEEPPAGLEESPAGLQERGELQRVREILKQGFGTKAGQLEDDDLFALAWALPRDIPDLLDLYGKALGISLTKAQRERLSGQMLGAGWKRPGVRVYSSQRQENLEETFDSFHSWMPPSIREAVDSLLAASTWDEFISRRLPHLEKAIAQYLKSPSDEFWKSFFRRLIEPAPYSAEHEGILLKTAQRVADAFDPGNPENPQRIMRWLKATYPANLRNVLLTILQTREESFQGKGEAFKRAFKSEVAKRLQGASYSEHVEGELLRFVITASEDGGSPQKLANVAAHEYTHEVLRELGLAPWQISKEETSEADWIAEASATLIQARVSEELGEAARWRTAAGIGPTLNRWLIDQGQRIARGSTSGWSYRLGRILKEIPDSQKHYTTGKLIAGIAWQLGSEVKERQPQANAWEQGLSFVSRFARESGMFPHLGKLADLARGFRQSHGLPLEYPTDGLEEVDAQYFALAAEESSVFVVLGQTAFEQLPPDQRLPFRMAVEALRQTRLGKRLIVLPKDPTNEELFDVIVQASQLPDPYLVAYAKEDDPAMSQFIDAVEDSQIPFYWIRWDKQAPAAALYLRQIILHLGLPEGVATQEAVERFIATVGLEQAA